MRRSFNPKLAAFFMLLWLPIGLYYWWATETMPEDAQRAMDEIRDPLSNPGKLEERRVDAERLWTAARASLREGDFNRAVGQIQSAVRIFESADAGHVFSTGETAIEWSDGQFEVTGLVVSERYDVMKTLLEKGEAWVSDMEVLVNRVAGIGNLAPQVAEDWETAKREIELARAQQAGSWIRIQYIGPRDYRNVIEDIIVENWPDDAVMRPVFGKPLGTLERRTTWRELELRIQHDTTTYEPRNPSKSQIGSIDIPIGFTMTYKMDSGPETTTWDRLDAYALVVDSPESITVDTRNSRHEEVEALRERNLEQVREALRVRLSQLPALALFPDRESVEQLTLDSVTSLSDCLAYLHLDRERFLNDLDRVTFDRTDERESVLLQTLIRAGVPEGRERVRRNLPRINVRFRHGVMKALEFRPWYEDYCGVLAAISSGERDLMLPALRAIEGMFGEQKLRDALARALSGASRDTRIELMRFYVRNLAAEELGSVNSWMFDSDPAIAMSVYEALNRRDPAYAMNLFLENFDRLADPVRAHGISRFKYNPELHGVRGLDVLDLALRSNDLTVVMAGYQALENAAQVYADAWDLLRERVGIRTDPGGRSRSMTVLINSARRIKGEDGELWLLDRLDLEHERIQSGDGRGDPRVHQLMIGALVYTDEPKRELIADLSAMATDGDAELLESILRPVAQHLPLRSGWDFAQPELHSLLSRATEIEDPQLRGRIYYGITEAYRRKSKELKPVISGLYSREADPALKGKLIVDQ